MIQNFTDAIDHMKDAVFTSMGKEIDEALVNYLSELFKSGNLKIYVNSAERREIVKVAAETGKITIYPDRLVDFTYLSYEDGWNDAMKHVKSLCKPRNTI